MVLEEPTEAIINSMFGTSCTPFDFSTQEAHSVSERSDDPSGAADTLVVGNRSTGKSTRSFSSIRSPSFEHQPYPPPAAKIYRNPRHQKLAALAKKFSNPDIHKDPSVHELDDIDADLIAEQNRNRELFTLLEQAREEMGRLQRQLNYRQEGVTDLEEALQTERDRVTELCAQREQHEAEKAKLTTRIRTMRASDLALREECRSMEEELEDAREVIASYEGDQEEMRMFVDASTQTLPDTMRGRSEKETCQCVTVTSPSKSLQSSSGHLSRSPLRDPPQNPKRGPNLKPQPKRYGSNMGHPRLTEAMEHDPNDGPILLSLSPESTMCVEELRALEDGIYQASNVAERGMRFGDLKVEIKSRGLEGMSKQKMEGVLASYG